MALSASLQATRSDCCPASTMRYFATGDSLITCPSAPSRVQVAMMPSSAPSGHSFPSMEDAKFTSMESYSRVLLSSWFTSQATHRKIAVDKMYVIRFID